MNRDDHTHDWSAHGRCLICGRTERGLELERLAWERDDDGSWLHNDETSRFIRGESDELTFEEGES